MGVNGKAAVFSVLYYVALSACAPAWLESPGFYAGLIACWLFALGIVAFRRKQPVKTLLATGALELVAYAAAVLVAGGLWLMFGREASDPVLWPYDVMQAKTHLQLSTLVTVCVTASGLIAVMTSVLVVRRHNAETSGNR